MARIAAYRKVIVFAAGAALTIAIQVWGTSNVYVAAAVLVATGLGVYHAPNAPKAPPVPAPEKPAFPAGTAS